MDKLADQLNDVTIAMYLADPDAFCATKSSEAPAKEANGVTEASPEGTEMSWDQIPTNIGVTPPSGTGSEISRISTSDEEAKHTNVEVEENNINDNLVSNSALCEFPVVQPVVTIQNVPTVTEAPVSAVQEPANALVQSVKMIQTAEGNVKKIIIVRLPTAQVSRSSPPTTTLASVPAPTLIPPPALPAPVPAQASQTTLVPASSKSNLTLREKQKGKPPLTYIALISKALLSSPTGHLEINGIYNYIMENYPFYRTTTLSWKNAIRHNLSVSECFVKAGKMGSSRLFLWGIHPECVEAFKTSDFSYRPSSMRQYVRVIKEIL